MRLVVVCFGLLLATSPPAPPAKGVRHVNTVAGVEGAGTARSPWVGWEAAFSSIPATGGAWNFPPGIYRQTSFITLPVNTSGWMRIRGYGATIVSTPSAPRVFDIGRTADGQTFNKVSIQGLHVDAADLGGRHHALLGTYIDGSATSGQGLSIRDIDIRDVTIRNLLSDARTRINHRLGIQLFSIANAKDRLTRIERVAVRNVRVEGGNGGITIAGGYRSVVGPANVLLDQIDVRDCHTSGQIQPTTFYSSSGIHVGNRGYGRRVRILDNDVRWTGDVGIEVNAFEDALVEGNTVHDVYAAAFYFTNYNGSLDVDKQRLLCRNNRSFRSLAPSGNPEYGQSFRFNTDGGGFDIGHVVLESNTSSITSSDFQVLGYGLHIRSAHGHGFRSVTVRGFSSVNEGFAETAPSPLGNPIAVRIAAGSGPNRIEVSDLYVRAHGTVAISGITAFVALELSGKGTTFAVDGATFDLTVNAMPAFGLRGIVIGQTTGRWTMSGSIRRAAFPTFVGDEKGQPIRISASTVLTIPAPITITDCDFKGLARKSRPVSFGDAINARRVTVSNRRAGTPLRP